LGERPVSTLYTMRALLAASLAHVNTLHVGLTKSIGLPKGRYLLIDDWDISLNWGTARTLETKIGRYYSAVVTLFATPKAQVDGSLNDFVSDPKPEDWPKLNGPFAQTLADARTVSDDLKSNGPKLSTLAFYKELLVSLMQQECASVSLLSDLGDGDGCDACIVLAAEAMTEHETRVSCTTIRPIVGPPTTAIANVGVSCFKCFSDFFGFRLARTTARMRVP
jgi:hypothetical protein